MRLSNPAKIFLLVSLFLPIFASCGGSNNNQISQTGNDVEPKNGFPFSASEPQAYQADAIITFGGKVRKIHIAKKDEKRRVDYDAGTDIEHSLITGEMKIVSSSVKKIYAEVPADGDYPAGKLDDLTQGLLNAGQDTKFEKISSDNNITKYRIINGQEKTSELFIYTDAELGLPIRTEHFSLTGGERKLLYSFELKNVSRDVDDSLFKPNAGWKQVPYKEFLEAISPLK